MTGPRRNVRIPIAYRNMDQWPQPDISNWDRQAKDVFTKKKEAIILYGSGAKLDTITATTGILRHELRRLVQRCLEFADDGRIFGYRALKLGVRVKSYERKAEVKHDKGSGSGGCSGALTQLFERFPEIHKLVDDLFCKRPGAGVVQDARISISVIHSDFKNKLRELGLTDADWPFNTANVGYKSLFEYCKKLERERTQETTLARAGVEAGLRSHLGNGVRSQFPALRPYGAAQLDFHKVDAASVFVLKNDYGIELEVPLARWYIGVLAEEYSRSILGFAVVLALNPSADSTLETISNALSSRQPDFAPAFLSSNGSFVINQLIPELEYQAFSILKVDNAWANAAHEAVNNIIDTVGAAVNFGPVRAWDRRNMIEKLFEELTQRGLQRLPSTHGSGPKDTIIDHPNEKAAKFRITIEDLVDVIQRCIQEKNLCATEGRQHSAPAQILQNALANPASGFFRQPLPEAVQSHAKLMMHIEEVTVRGSLDKRVRPYFKLSRQRHTNEILANSYHLIGKKLIVYLDRRLARIVYATVKDTGQDLGRMLVSGPWAKSNCSWRDRNLMINAGMSNKYGSSSIDPVQQFKDEKNAELKQRPPSQKHKSSVTALTVVRVEAQQRTVVNIADVSPPAPKLAPSIQQKIEGATKDRFGLHKIPQID